MTTDKIDRDTATQEFERWAEEMDLDLQCYTEEDEADLEKHRNRILREIRRGNATVDDNGILQFTPSRSKVDDAIVFYEPTGATYQAIDGKKKGHDIKRQNAMLGDLTKQHPAVFAKLANSDFKFCQSVLALFLA